MGFSLKKFLGNPIGEIAGQILDGVDRFVETPDEKRAYKLIKEKLVQDASRWQAEINKIEAHHRSWFIAGWRPAVAWICVLSLFWGWVAHPILSSFLRMPPYDITAPYQLLVTLLGLASFRTVEKVKGVTK